MILALAIAVPGVAALAQPQPPLSAPAQDPRRLTLQQALRLAEDAEPTLRRKRAELLAAEGARAEASALLFNNPQASVETTRRQVPQSGLPTERRREWGAGLSQTLEIAGQQGHRRRAAQSVLEAGQAEVADVRRRVLTDTAVQFYRLVYQQRRLRIDEQAVALLDTASSAVQKRKAAGEDTRLDANVAAVEAERARNQAAVTREQLADLQADLAAKLQLPPPAIIVAEEPSERAPLRVSQDELSGAAANAPRLRAVATREEAAAARLKLEQASTYPDVTVGVQVGREGAPDARERLTTFSVSIPLPLFKRNDAGIGQARSELEQARIEHQSAMNEQRSQVYSLWTKLQSLSARVERLRTTVLPALQNNEALSAKSQKAGQISVLDLMVVNRQSLDARRDLLEAELDYQLTRLALEAAIGQPIGGIAP
ncbi:TolC family protein [Piscinibacter terrae]|nr:TolC family protein [Albitalea terrae]